MKTSKYFKPEEFERCNPSCSIEDMDQDFLNLLDDLREKAGIPLVLNCAYRSKEHDKPKDGPATVLTQKVWQWTSGVPRAPIG